MECRLRTFILFILFTGYHAIKGQSIFVGDDILELSLRSYQIQGDSIPNYSFLLRPLYSNKNEGEWIIVENDSVKFKNSILDKSWIEFSLLNPSVNTEFNSKFPFGWNNGALIRSKGFQQLLGAGFYGRLGPLKVQFYPEMVWAQNLQFEDSTSGFENSINNKDYLTKWWTNVQLPLNFGNGFYQHLYPGQSFAYLEVQGTAVGVSTENIWWGPGIVNSLMMSNNSPGFLHLTMKSTRPLKSPIGNFEYQVIVGKLDPLDEIRAGDWQYLSGLMVVYSPKWISGLSLGFSRTFQQYWSSVKKNKEYLPVLNQFLKNNRETNVDLSVGDQYLSINGRWFFTKTKSELYFEYGRNDASWNFRDFAQSPTHSRAYTFGFSQELTVGNRPILIRFEDNHLERSGTAFIRAEPPWYMHQSTDQGYTYRGEAIGAGIGPGSNSQTFMVELRDGFDSKGVVLQRIVRDQDFFGSTTFSTNEEGRWIDLSLGAYYQQVFKKISINSKIQMVKSHNYQWQYRPNVSGLNEREPLVRYNLFISADFKYHF